ncbi:MAG: toll/interleukin-1 receptor domain-containing protein, partial [Nitrososphaera sp.]|nr:toll/interleukin-1 receptor domain-containing protein [Nitrososphaera sp.]
MAQIKVFISYSWDSEGHKAWVHKLADHLEEVDEIHVTWDGYDLDALVDKNRFMESGIVDADFVLIVTTKGYKKKADERIGGVGIETFLASAKHWDNLLRTKKTRVIAISREPDSTPNYLNGHLHLDFVDDRHYAQGIAEILSYFRGTQRAPRPSKKRSLKTNERLYSFEGFEQILAITYTNRRALVNAEEGTDFSGSNRVNYELWETRSPARNYFLNLQPSANVTHTIRHALQKLREANIRPADLTVLRPHAMKAEQTLISELFKEARFSTQVHQYSYKEYIWDFCIEESLKGIAAPSPVANYTEQSLVPSKSTAEEGTIADSALKFVTTILQTPSSAAAYLVVASGGMGKTSLCLAVAARLHNRSDLRSSVVFIQAEAL